jgi:hypothetical protein
VLIVVLGTKQKGRRASLVGRGGMQLALLLDELLLLAELLLQCGLVSNNAGQCECLDIKKGQNTFSCLSCSGAAFTVCILQCERGLQTSARQTAARGDTHT